MKQLDPTWEYGLLAYIQAAGGVTAQRPIPAKTFDAIVRGAGSHPYALTFRQVFYLFSMTQVVIEGGTISPGGWLSFRTRDDALAKGVGFVTSPSLAGSLGFIY